MSQPTAAAPENKLRQIQALLDRATHDKTPPEEAEQAMNRAMDLMAKYGVDEMMVAARAPKAEEIIKVKIDIAGSYSQQQATLAHRIGEALNCKVVQTSANRKVYYIHIVGYESDVRRTEMLYTSLLLQMIHGVRRARPASYFGTASDTKVYKRNWMAAFAQRVGDRLEEAERQARSDYDRAAASSSGGEGTEVVLRDRSHAVADTYRKMFPDAKRVKSRSVYDGSAREAGDAAGRRANIGTTGLGGQRAAIGR